jgi:hypothetical protein
MRNQAQQHYFDNAYKHLNALILSGVPLHDALWDTRTTYMLTAIATLDLKDQYNNEEK